MDEQPLLGCIAVFVTVPGQGDPGAARRTAAVRAILRRRARNGRSVSCRVSVPSKSNAATVRLPLASGSLTSDVQTPEDRSGQVPEA